MAVGDIQWHAWRERVLYYAGIVVPIAEATHGSITSWGRSESHNRLVGGHPDSRHRLWLAWDLEFSDEGSRHSAFRDLRAAEMHGYTWEPEGKWMLHIQDRPAPAP